MILLFEIKHEQKNQNWISVRLIDYHDKSKKIRIYYRVRIKSVGCVVEWYVALIDEVIGPLSERRGLYLEHGGFAS